MHSIHATDVLRNLNVIIARGDMLRVMGPKQPTTEALTAGEIIQQVASDAIEDVVSAGVSGSGSATHFSGFTPVSSGESGVEGH